MQCLLSRLLLFLLPAAAVAQNSAEFKEILDRLTRLEQENRQLASEVHALRQQIANGAVAAVPLTSPVTAESEGAPAASTQSSATAAERLDVTENRVQELAQTKV